MDKTRKVLADEWFDSALSDYEYAQLGLKEEVIFPQVALLSQQVTEKFLKGFLILRGTEPPRIHDLPKVGSRQCKDNLKDKLYWHNYHRFLYNHPDCACPNVGIIRRINAPISIVYAPQVMVTANIKFNVH